jgi:hypothetical protein
VASNTGESLIQPAHHRIGVILAEQRPELAVLAGHDVDHHRLAAVRGVFDRLAPGGVALLAVLAERIP